MGLRVRGVWAALPCAGIMKHRPPPFTHVVGGEGSLRLHYHVLVSCNIPRPLLLMWLGGRGVWAALPCTGIMKHPPPPFTHGVGDEVSWPLAVYKTFFYCFWWEKLPFLFIFKYLLHSYIHLYIQFIDVGRKVSFLKTRYCWDYISCNVHIQIMRKKINQEEHLSETIVTNELSYCTCRIRTLHTSIAISQPNCHATYFYWYDTTPSFSLQKTHCIYVSILHVLPY